MAGRIAARLRPEFAALAVLALGLIAVVGGCGGGGGSAASDTSVATGETRQEDGSREEAGQGEDGQSKGGKSAFIVEADEVCGAAQKKMQAEFAPYLQEEGGFATLAKLSPKLSREIFVPGLEAEIAGLGELDSSGAEAQAEALIRGFENMVSEAKSEPKEFVFNSAGATDIEKFAREAGFKVCGPLL